MWRRPLRLRFGNGKLIDGIGKDGLTNVYHQTAMGVSADLRQRAEDHREEQDAFAIESYKRSANAWAAGKFKDEVVPVTVQTRKGDVVVSEDEEYKNVNFEKLPALKPVFTKDGTRDRGERQHHQRRCGRPGAHERRQGQGPRPEAPRQSAELRRCRTGPGMVHHHPAKAAAHCGGEGRP
jgi:acetyl-CoA acetyltransferase